MTAVTAAWQLLFVVDMKKELSRRGFLGGTATGAAALAVSRVGRSAGKPKSKPNILVIMVDEMRIPYGPNGFIPLDAQQALMPNLSALFAQSACFHNHYTAATACSPSRASLLTGLYAHQHYVLGTIATPQTPTLNSGFPTWGTVLNQQGYDTWWWGKWHLASLVNEDLTPYGFSGQELVDPVGTAGEGLDGPINDEAVATQFISWLQTRPNSGPKTPFCTTVSFVNPHDVQWFYKDSDCVTPAGSSTPNEFGPFTGPSGAMPGYTSSFLYPGYWQQNLNGLPCANFENPNGPPTGDVKPALQPAAAADSASQNGYISYTMTPTSPDLPPACSGGSSGIPQPPGQPYDYWYKMQQLYMYLQHSVDLQIGRVLQAVWSNPLYAENTIVIFTSDHGEYAGAHGLRGKLGSVYREAMQIPLAVYDPTQTYVTSATTPRMAMTSSVDVMPLILSLGGNGSPSTWSNDPALSYLSTRCDLSAMLQDPTAAGRPYVLHTTDEFVTLDPAAPLHAVGYRTCHGLLGVYSNWVQNRVSIDPTAPQQYELYDYQGGDRSEVTSTWSTSNLTTPYMQALFGTSGAYYTELQAALPSWLQPTQNQAISDFLIYAAEVAVE